MARSMARSRRPVILLGLLTLLGGALARAQAPADAVDSLVEAGDRALKEGRFGEALDAFARAAALAPRDPSIATGAGYASARLGRLTEAATWLQRAVTLRPDLTSASALLAQVLYAQGKVPEAVAVVDAALAHDPRDTVLRGLAEKWRDEARRDARLYEARGAHFSVRFEGPADDTAARRVVEILEQAYLRIGGILSTYPREPVTVVLYTREQFRDITRSPGWAGGVYDGRIKIPMIGALDRAGDLRRILEHEFVHALVASLAGSTAPAWLNEGLAAALEPGDLGWAHETLRVSPRRIPYAELERGFGRLSDREAAVAYAQSSLVVKRLLDLRGPAAMIALLQSLGTGVPFETAFQASMHMRVDELQALMGRV
jgi:tetratricopeptide (TPR) repeat protein